jgi:uncharacterized delta-60 repeat protein
MIKLFFHPSRQRREGFFYYYTFNKPNHMKKILLIIISCYLSFICFAQPGSLDLTFDPGTGANTPSSTYIWTTAIQSDGKIIIGGNFTNYNGTDINRIARLNPDGSLDTGFNPGTGPDSVVTSCSVQPDGKLIICGEFLSYNGMNRNRIVRLNADGSLDNGFNIGTGTNGSIESCSLQPDGKIIIVGGFNNYNGSARSGIARINADGSLDNSFSIGTGSNGQILASKLQADGKILIGGYFTSFNGTARSRIARLNTDGSLDTGFNPGAGASQPVRTFSVQPDGKIIIGGSFSTFNTITRKRIARLNSDGSLDVSFDPGTGASSQVNTSILQQDGKIIIGGNFSTYNDSVSPDIARLNADGSFDDVFNVGTGSNNSIQAFILDSDGKLIIVGHFTTYNTISRNRIARINVSDLECNADFNLYPDITPLHYIAENLATGTAPLDYIWDWGDGTTDNIAYPSHTYDIAGNYTICLTITDANNCTDTYCNVYSFKTESPVAYINVIDPLTVGIAQSEKEKGGLIIYPNPATNTIRVESELQKSNYELSDISGKLLLSGDANTQKFTLDLSAYQNGLYLLTLIGEEKTARMKIVKQ